MDVDSAFGAKNIGIKTALQWSHVLMDVDRHAGILQQKSRTHSFNGATS